MTANTFYTTITDAIADLSEHGFDSEERLNRWMAAIRKAALESMTPADIAENALRVAMTSVYARMVDKHGALKYNPGVNAFTIERVKPKLRAELDRRIAASANLIKLNRQQSIETTLRRFSGWASSVPAGGSQAVDRRAESGSIRKSLAQLPFEARRVAIDQGHKLTAAINEIVAVEGGAIAAEWFSHYRQPGYNYRVDHKERDGKIYLIRGNWAQAKGYVKPGPAGYTDQITMVGEEVFCRCLYIYRFSLSKLPDDMLTEKGRMALADVKARMKA